MLNLWTRYGIEGADERVWIADVSCRTRDEIKIQETKYKNAGVITRAWAHCGATCRHCWSGFAIQKYSKNKIKMKKNAQRLFVRKRADSPNPIV